MALLAFNLIAVAGTLVGVSPRIVIDWNAGWRFSKGEFAAAMSPGFDDGGWRPVSAPHDWSTEEPFRADYGSGNGYAAGGIGWYRKHFQTDPAWEGRAVAVEFDGVYANAEVWLNGQFVGGRPYGYSSFALELTPFLKSGAADNVLAVRVDHSRFADSRWYTGSGIYRQVRLVVADPLRIAHWGTCVTTPTATAEAATVRIETVVQNDSDSGRTFTVQSDILDADGQVVTTAARRVLRMLAPRRPCCRRPSCRIPAFGRPTRQRSTRCEAACSTARRCATRRRRRLACEPSGSTRTRVSRSTECR
jgi:beta-galactosidase